MSNDTQGLPINRENLARTRRALENMAESVRLADERLEANLRRAAEVLRRTSR